MNITIFILTLLTLLNIVFLQRFISDLIRHKQKFLNETANSFLLACLLPIIFFLATFGMSDYALSTLFYRKFKLLPDKQLPATLNTQCVIPLAAMAFAFISVVDVDLTTLVLCIIAQIIGAYLGPRVVVRLSQRVIRISIATGLILATIFILAGKFSLLPTGGMALGLSGVKLVIALVCLFTFGALNNIGIGSFAPTMITIYALGMNPLVAFPIMMGGAAFSVPVASMEFIRYGEYSRKITLFASTFGLIGVLVAVFLVKQLDIAILQWLMAAVLFYTGSSILFRELKTPTLVPANSPA